MTISGVTDPRVIAAIPTTTATNDTLIFTVGQLGTTTTSVTVTRVSSPTSPPARTCGWSCLGRWPPRRWHSS